MEDDLKILKVEYLSNHLPVLPKILNSSIRDKPKLNIVGNEDNLQWKTTSKY